MNDAADRVAQQPGQQLGASPVPGRSFTWVYFFAASDKAAIQPIPGVGGHPLTRYRVDQVVGIRGKPTLNLKPGATLFRLEVPQRLPALDAAGKSAVHFQGVTQHFEYTTQLQRDELVRRSRPELASGKDTVAVLIPIRKTAAWWALPQDLRHAHFQQISGDKGHTAIGAQYADRIYRKLYHTRYSVDTTDHDFLTYFEFDRANTGDFDSLLAKLRDGKANPEWDYVDQEYEIRMTKAE